MKKFLTLVLAICMIVVVCSCGKEQKKSDYSDVKKELNGLWVYYWYASAVDLDCYSLYDFGKNGKVTHFTVRGEEQSDEEYGKYTITEDEIVVKMDDGEQVKFSYQKTKKGLKLTNYTDGTVTEEYVKIEE